MPERHSFYEILLEQPLFQGMGKDDITTIVGKAKMDFRNFKEGDIVCEENAPCKELLFLLSGDIDISHQPPNHRLTFTETLHSPSLPIGTECIFGLIQNHDRTYVAKTQLQTLAINKRFVVQHLLIYDVFLYNLLGILSTRIQRANIQMWDSPKANLTQRFVQICQSQFSQQQGSKKIIGKMTDLAKHLQTTRLNTSIMLNTLEDNGIIQLTRQHITIPHFEQLIQFSRNLTFAH